MMVLNCEAVRDVFLFVQRSPHTCVYVIIQTLRGLEIAISLASDS